MKQYSSRVLKTIAALFLIFPVIYIILVATLFNIPAQSCLGILFTLFYYIVTLSVVVAGYGLWEMKRWSWYLVLFSQILVFSENFSLVRAFADTHHAAMALFISSFIQFLVVYRIALEVRVPYLFPRTRWWESDPKYKVAIAVHVQRKDGSKCDGDILDLSMAGCFIKTRNNLQLDERIVSDFSVFGSDVRCEGTVVWSTESSVTCPKGVGVKFSTLPKGQKRILRKICRKLNKVFALFRNSRYIMSQDEFLKKLHEIEDQKPDERHA